MLNMKQISDENSKNKILKAATRLFAQKGFDGTSVREICREAGVNLCMISYYFGGKEELYQGIVEDLVERQTAYAKTFIDFEKSPFDMTKKEQTDTLMLILDRSIDFFYSNISGDLIVFMLKEQRNTDFAKKSPAFDYLRKLLAAVFNKKENDREIILRTVFVISQINSPGIFSSFSLSQLGQTEFSQDDIIIIKNNIKLYVNALIKEVNK